ncbi:hypothetical protein EV359DRAFT_69178 [Lentinula novae-zelandiae]|nr:hypothetical protein EV359DRAFT_69178 [Lentinula novae-zelandiae]
MSDCPAKSENVVVVHSSYERQENAIRYGGKKLHAKWGYQSGERSTTFRPHLFGIITDIKTSSKDLGYGINEYLTVVLGYPNVQHDMVSGNFYNQLVSLREQIYKDIEERIYVNQNERGKHVYKVKGVKLDQRPQSTEVFSETLSMISRGWHPGLIEKGALVVAEVELKRIDHLWKEPLTMFYNVIAHQVVVHAHSVDVIEGVKHDL